MGRKCQSREKAIMVMLDNAVKAISNLVPENYYRYK